MLIKWFTLLSVNMNIVDYLVNLTDCIWNDIDVKLSFLFDLHMRRDKEEKTDTPHIESGRKLTWICKVRFFKGVSYLPQPYKQPASKFSLQ